MKDSHVPVKYIYSLNDPTDHKGHITLGPLVCSGSAGRSRGYTMSIRNRRSAVSVGAWKGHSLSFEFRTYLENATIVTSNDGKLGISMLNRSLHLIFDNQVNLTLIPQSRFHLM
ncbi:unnamed protein product [Gongylonema pulchrum]|uniref:Uncharacterized protein n=1 Tax=Gongylonema pulchrum TaxID=637853 RepID=A0A3P6SPQ2_9BILA|nr:unnamed protein product [Gongylonema pulchrum]